MKNKNIGWTIYTAQPANARANSPQVNKLLACVRVPHTSIPLHPGCARRVGNAWDQALPAPLLTSGPSVFFISNSGTSAGAKARGTAMPAGTVCRADDRCHGARDRTGAAERRGKTQQQQKGPPARVLRRVPRRSSPRHGSL